MVEWPQRECEAKSLGIGQPAPLFVLFESYDDINPGWARPTYAGAYGARATPGDSRFPWGTVSSTRGLLVTFCMWPGGEMVLHSLLSIRGRSWLLHRLLCHLLPPQVADPTGKGIFGNAWFGRPPGSFKPLRR